MPLCKVLSRHCVMCTPFHVKEILNKTESAMGFHWAGPFYVLSREMIAAEHKAIGTLPLAGPPRKVEATLFDRQVIQFTEHYDPRMMHGC